MLNSSEYVLIVDDDEDFHSLLESIFSKHGIRSEVAETGEQAFSKFQETPPKLIIMDYVLPDQTGDVVLKRIRSDAKGKDIPIVSISVHKIENSEGWTEVMRKPLSIAQIEEVINKYLIQS